MMMLATTTTGYEPEEEKEILEYLIGMYRNVFTEAAIRAHLVNHVGYPVAQYGLDVVRPHLPPHASILDVGAGFGSFVLLARNAGFDSTGIEVAPYEVERARRRLQRIRPQDDPEAVYQLGDARTLEGLDATFDAITLWNVLEHIDSVDTLIGFAARALRRGGYVFIVCPNYAARRDEAHYHVPWRPELRNDRAAVSNYLRSLGRDSTFFETSIFCRTNAEVLRVLRKHRFDLFDIEGFTPMSLSLPNLPGLVRNWRQAWDFYSPRRPSVLVAGRRI